MAMQATNLHIHQLHRGHLMENFVKINENIQERLRALEAQQQVFFALLAGIIETHPKPEVLRKQFAFHFETIHSVWLNNPLAEDWIDAGVALHKAIDGTFDRPRL
jgi:hypothetical protein